jgi:hypothetical protein
LSEVILSLILIAIAPNFLNSDKPIVGFLIWLSVPVVLGSSGTYVAWRIIDAQKARQVFIRHFPEYNHLQTTDFLEISSQRVVNALPLLQATKSDQDFPELNINLFELLRQIKNNGN